MIFHENRLLADDSHETSYLIFFGKLGKLSQNVSTAAHVIGAVFRFYTALTNVSMKYLVMCKANTDVYVGGLK